MAAAGVPVLPGYDGADQDAGDCCSARRRGSASRCMVKARGRRRRPRHAPGRDAERSSPRRSRRAAPRRQRPSATRACCSNAPSTRARHVEIQVFADAHGHVDPSRRARLLGAAPAPEARSRRRPRPRSRRRCARAWARPRSRSRAPSATSAPARSSSCSIRRRVLLHRDEHAAAGRASGDRGAARHRPASSGSCASPPAKRCRWRRTSAGALRGRRPRDRGAPVRRGSGEGYPAAVGPHRPLVGAAAWRAHRPRASPRRARSAAVLRLDARQADRPRADARRARRRAARRARSIATVCLGRRRPIAPSSPACCATPSSPPARRRPISSPTQLRRRRAAPRRRADLARSARRRDRSPCCRASICRRSGAAGRRRRRSACSVPLEVGGQARTLDADRNARRRSSPAAATCAPDRRPGRTPRQRAGGERRGRDRRPRRSAPPSAATATPAGGSPPAPRLAVDRRCACRAAPARRRARPADVLRADARPGDAGAASRPAHAVDAGALLVVIEAMKMEHQLRAPHAGTVGCAACRAPATRSRRAAAAWSSCSREPAGAPRARRAPSSTPSAPACAASSSARSRRTSPPGTRPGRFRARSTRRPPTPA